MVVNRPWGYSSLWMTEPCYNLVFFILSMKNISKASWPFLIKFHKYHHWGAALSFGIDQIVFILIASTMCCMFEKLKTFTASCFWMEKKHVYYYGRTVKEMLFKHMKNTKKSISNLGFAPGPHYLQTPGFLRAYDIFGGWAHPPKIPGKSLLNTSSNEDFKCTLCYLPFVCFKWSLNKGDFWIEVVYLKQVKLHFSVKTRNIHKKDSLI